MKFHCLLDGVFGQRSKVSLLRFLVRTQGEHSGRDLARMVNLDHKTCHTALQDLVKQGLVRFSRIGSAHVYGLNPAHVVVTEMLVPLFEREQALLEGYVRDLRKQLQPKAEAIILFGSVARREEGPGSDVDLLWVASDKRAAEAIRQELDAATTKMVSRYGSVPQVLVDDVRSFRNRVTHADPLYNEILRTGKVVYGKSFAELLKHGS